MRKFFVLIIFGFAFFFLGLSPALAGVGGTACTIASSTGVSGVWDAAGMNCVAAPTAPTTLTNPLNPTNNPNYTIYWLIGRIIAVVLGLVGSIALVMFIYGGIIWMTSAGSSERVKKGRDAILWAVIGMAVIFASYGLTKFLIEKISTPVA